MLISLPFLLRIVLRREMGEFLDDKRRLLVRLMAAHPSDVTIRAKNRRGDGWQPAGLAIHSIPFPPLPFLRLRLRARLIVQSLDQTE